MDQVTTGAVTAALETKAAAVELLKKAKGQQQKFARSRAQRDAEDRAAKVIADQIRSRLASYLVAGT